MAIPLTSTSFDRAKDTAIYCEGVQLTHSGTVAQFTLRGTSGESYIVKVGSKYYSCGCPDYQNNAKKLVCKHLIHVLQIFLRLSKNIISTLRLGQPSPPEFAGAIASWKQRLSDPNNW